MTKGKETWLAQKKLDNENNDFQTFHPWKLISKSMLTPDVNHYIFQPPNKVKSRSCIKFSNTLQKLSLVL